MKKHLFLFTILLFMILGSKNVFAYTFPQDFNYSKAKNSIISNGVQYNSDKYFISRYPYSGNDSQYIGKFTQNFSWSGSV